MFVSQVGWGTDSFVFIQREGGSLAVGQTAGWKAVWKKKFEENIKEGKGGCLVTWGL